ncbi:sigma factor-like helix-turn-helix DNA-binding protein [Solibacillus silvestris]
MYFEDLLEEYRELLGQMKLEGVTSGEMFREVKQAIEWMETGYDPAEYRAATRVDAFPMDPYHMQSYVSYLNDDDEMLLPDYLQVVRKKIISDFCTDVEPLQAESYVRRFFSDYARLSDMSWENKQEINGALKGLSANEKASFIAIEAEKMPYAKVATMLGVEKTTVQSYVRRAWQKIRANLDKGTQESLFDDIA